MSHLKELRDLDCVEHPGEDEWGACCYWVGTFRCHCAKYADVTPSEGPSAADRANNPPREHIARWEVRK